MLYNNELMKVAMAVTQGSLTQKYGLGYGSVEKGGFGRVVRTDPDMEFCDPDPEMLRKGAEERPDQFQIGLQLFELPGFGPFGLFRLLRLFRLLQVRFLH